MTILTAKAFEMLLKSLDVDETQAVKKYEELRLILVKCFIWRGCAEVNADWLADETFNRIASKLTQVTEVKNVNAFAREISRYVWLEHQRKYKEEGFGDELPVIAVKPQSKDDEDLRIICLKSCLNEISSDKNDRLLILGYYDADENEKNKHHRNSLAEKLGITMNTLKVKACRLRLRLEKCINKCIKK